MENGVMYRKSYLVPLMRCVASLQANYIIREVHMGLCGMHDRPRPVVAKAMYLGYYWPFMHRDARELIRACDDCQELHLNSDLLDERREIAAKKEARKNEASRAANTCKLGPTWEGPYKVIQEFQSRAYKLSNMEGEEIPRTWHACNLQRLVPSCCMIFDLESLSLSFDFVFDFKIFKYFPCLS
uniref:Reverse transcriptase domain-containing protein n=1 Tax=Tanacetum cinerariifolium TaxID=118510 RepID=A0A6L2M464_TANCI|nr:reverse transcriptase domain-containing protein [Tanacetum cinerariifolium]